ncbi:hypothetical protein [Neptunicella sp.]|uniref:hypothetical protein n=1 Tax=Neptunicella sp. TaxID=2125986 RepID=UPI003F68EA26
MLTFYKTTGNLGGAATATETDGSDLFDAFNDTETNDGTTEYACIVLETDVDYSNARMYIESETAHTGVNWTFGLGSAAINAEEQTIANKNTAPADVTFTDAEGLANALTIGDMVADDTKAIWVKVVIAPGTLAKDVYNFVLKAAGGIGE